MKTIGDIAHKNREIGRYWFSQSTLEWWSTVFFKPTARGSFYSKKAWRGEGIWSQFPLIDGKYFITADSLQNIGMDAPLYIKICEPLFQDTLRFSIREAHPDGIVTTFNFYNSVEECKEALKKLLENA